MDRKPTLEQHARELMGLPDDWYAFRYSAIGTAGESAWRGVTVTGAVVRETYKRGPRKGALNWKKRLRETETPVTVPMKLHRQWLREWEIDTGKCSECSGSGKIPKSWSKEEGAVYRECTRCKGSGIAPRAEAEAEHV